MTTEFDVTLPDGRTLHGYDTGGVGDLTVIWHHGTPNLGFPPAPLFEAAGRLGIRWLSFDRPGYGGSTPLPGRTVADAAVCAAALADARGVGSFAVMGHSGGGPHALACAALLPDRVFAGVSIAGLAPYGAEGLDWFAGMAEGGVAGLRAALEGREAKERFENSGAEYEIGFTEGDWAALSGEWAWLGGVAMAAMKQGPGGLIDDDLAYVNPWGFDPGSIAAPLFFIHGRADRVVPSMHSAWLCAHVSTPDFLVTDSDGHVTILERAEEALEWLRRRADERG